MKLTFEIPDSITEKKTFSKSKLERDVHALLYLRLYQEGFIADRDIGNILSSYKLENSKKKNGAENRKRKNSEITPGKKFLKLQGMWKNRTDMTETIEYLQNLRMRIGNREI